MTVLSYRFACRRRTAAEWTSLNEVLLKAEIGLETDTGKFKFGDGTTAWNALAYQTTDRIPEGATNKYFTDERAQDAVAAMIAAGTHSGITFTYNDASNSLSATVSGGGGVTDGDKGDIVVSGSGAAWAIDTAAVTTAKIADNAITYAKLQDVSATARILGRKTAAAGDAEECTLSDILDFVGSAAQGDILYRGASGWTRLGAGTSGQVLKTGGAGADPSWGVVPTGSGGAMSLVGTATVAGSAATTLTLSGLDLATDGCYVVHAVLKNATASDSDCSLYYNGDTTSGNYCFQVIAGVSTAVQGAAVASGVILTLKASSHSFADIRIRRDVDGNPRAVSHVARGQGTTTPTTELQLLSHLRKNTANVTSITLSSAVASALAVGSYFKVFKVSS